MANKYIIHGATFNGDGTSSASAASNGGVGAWNTITYFEGTTPAFGTLVAGDTVYIRAKDAAGAAITVTLTASKTLGSAAATTGSYINWIIDSGAVWSGISGVIKYTHASTWTTTVRASNRVVCETAGSFVIENTSTNQSAGTVLAVNSGEMVGVKLDWSNKTGTGECIACTLSDNSLTENIEINWGAIGGVASDGRGLLRMVASTQGKALVVNPVISLNHSSVGMPVFYSGDSARGQITVLGGVIKGVGATSGQPLYRAANSAARFKAVGLRFPRTMDVVNSVGVGVMVTPGDLEVIGCDDGLGGHIEKEWGFATGRTDNNPPYLQALLPDTLGTPWSWRVYPKSASNANPMMMTCAKFFTGAAASKVIAQEILVANTMTVNAATLWISLQYQDSTTGLPVHVGTRNHSGTAIATSSANWSSSIWGAITFVKRKIEITTPSAIKQNTPIIVTVWCTTSSGSANDIFFIDPDFSVS